MQFSERISGSAKVQTQIAGTNDQGEKVSEFINTKFGGSLTGQVVDGLSVSAGALYDVDKEDISLTAGAGVLIPVTEKQKISLSGNVSHVINSDSIQGTVRSGYNYSDTNNFYLGYDNSLEPNSDSDIKGSAVLGGRTQLTDTIAITAEQRLGHFNDQITGLTNNFGLTFDPNSSWKIRFNNEIGTVRPEYMDDKVRRFATSASANFKQDNITGGMQLEYRFDDIEAKSTQLRSFMGRISAGYEVSAEIDINASLSALIAEKNEDLAAGNYINGSFGLVYRPKVDDNLIALASYRFYSDLEGDQDSVASNSTYKQRSHILSADVNYLLSKYMTLGSKYALKMGERTLTDMGDDFYSSTIHLGILRSNVHIVKNWDILVEGRLMHHHETSQTRTGLLAAVYRHVGDNFKIGAGYNFSGFSDDLTNTEADAQGWFVNAVAKF